MRKNPVGAVLVFIATIVVFLGLCLPFYELNYPGAELTVSLICTDKKILIIGLIWAVFAALTLLFAIIGVKITVLIFGILTSMGLFVSYIANNMMLEEKEALGGLVKKGIGCNLCLAGAVAILIAAIIYMATTKSKKNGTA